MAKGRYKPDVDHYNYVRCHSSRWGAKPRLIVVHSTQGSNIPHSIKDLVGLGNYFDSTYGTPMASSSTVAVDLDGNSARYVRDNDKPWTQAYYNPWSLSIENVGFANVTDWSDLLYRENARWIAFWCHRFDIRPYKGAVSKDGRILKSGVVRHSDLGSLGGGHRDPGLTFDLARVNSMARAYLKKY